MFCTTSRQGHIMNRSKAALNDSKTTAKIREEVVRWTRKRTLIAEIDKPVFIFIKNMKRRLSLETFFTFLSGNPFSNNSNVDDVTGARSSNS